MTETDVLSRENLRTPKAAAIAGMLLSLTAAFLARSMFWSARLPSRDPFFGPLRSRVSDALCA